MAKNELHYDLTPLRRADAAELARIHKEAFPGFFLSELGEGFLTQFYLGYSADPTAVTCVARSASGQIFGAVVGTTEPKGFYKRLLRRRLLGFGTAALIATLESPRRAPRLLRAISYRGEVPSADKDWALLASICVDPAVQASGLGSRLIERWTKLAGELGAPGAYLSTDKNDNQRVNDFYQRHGWTLNGTLWTREGRPMNQYVRSI